MNADAIDRTMRIPPYTFHTPSLHVCCTFRARFVQTSTRFHTRFIFGHCHSPKLIPNNNKQKTQTPKTIKKYTFLRPGFLQRPEPTPVSPGHLLNPHGQTLAHRCAGERTLFLSKLSPIVRTCSLTREVITPVRPKGLPESIRGSRLPNTGEYLNSDSLLATEKRRDATALHHSRECIYGV